MRAAGAPRAVASLQQVRELRVRSSQAALAAAKRALGHALEAQAQCERAVDQARTEREAYEREVFDRMAFHEQTQTVVRDAMVRLKSLALHIDDHRERLQEAAAHSQRCRELQDTARQHLDAQERARVKVDEWASRLHRAEATRAAQREEDTP